MYVLTFLFFLIATFSDIFIKLKKYQSILLQVFIIVILVAQMGLRWETGTDWLNYYENFQNTNNIENLLINVVIGYEVGYEILVYLFSSNSFSYTTFLLAHAILLYYIIFKTFNNLSPLPILSLLLFYSITIGLLGSNRQLISIALAMFSLNYVLVRKPIKFLFFILVAFLFHTSAISFVIVYFLNRDINKKYLLLFLFSSIVIGMTSIPQFIFDKFSLLLGSTSQMKANFYIENTYQNEFQLSLIGLFRRLVFIFICYFFYNQITIKYQYYKLFFNIYFVGILIYFIFNQSLLILINRGSIYFNIMECLLLPFIVLILKKESRYLAYILIFLYSIIMFYQSIAIYPDLFIPYKGVFINTDFNRDLY